MSLTDLDVKSVTAGTGSLSNFTINFEFQDETEVGVYLVEGDTETLQVNGTDYIISGNTVTMEVAPALGKDVVVIRETPLTQPTNLENAGPLTLANVEKRLDYLTQISQELSEKLDRAIKLPRSSSLTGMIFPDPTADKILGWNSGATALENKTLTLTGATAASQAEAEAGTNNTKYLTPLRTNQAFEYYMDRYGHPIATKNATFTAGASEEYFMCDTSGGSFIGNLPTAVGISGKRYTFKRIGTDYNYVTITPNGGESIDGAATTLLLRTPNESLTIMSDGAGWQVIERKGTEDLGDITTTLSWVTGVGTTVYNYFRSGPFMKVIGNIPITGAVTAANLTLTLPNSWAMNGTLFDANGGVPVGRCQIRDDSGTVTLDGVVTPSSATVLDFKYCARNVTTNFIDVLPVSNTAPVTFASGDRILFYLSIPMSSWID